MDISLKYPNECLIGPVTGFVHPQHYRKTTYVDLCVLNKRESVILVGFKPTSIRVERVHKKWLSRAVL